MLIRFLALFFEGQSLAVILSVRVHRCYSTAPKVFIQACVLIVANEFLFFIGTSTDPYRHFWRCTVAIRTVAMDYKAITVDMSWFSIHIKSGCSTTPLYI